MSRKYIAPQRTSKTLIAAAATTAGLFLVKYVPDTFGQDYYKRFIQCYRNGEPLSASAKVLERLDRAAKICRLEEYERALIKPFVVFGFDVSFAGSTKSRFGALLGIPTNYEYDSSADVQRSEIRFRDQSINWNTESGRCLEEALVLNEDEQVFSFCKALLQLKSHYVLLKSVFPSICFLTVYSVGHYLNSSLGLLARPLGLRLVMYAILGLFGTGSYCFMDDYYQVSSDAEIDKKLSALGPQFVEAGARYYDKLLKKNIALRDLLNDDTFTAKGNVNYYLRQKSLPLTIRKSYFESQLQGVEQQT